MKKFNLEIEFDESITDSEELALILKKVAQRIEKTNYSLKSNYVRGVIDIKGDSCGSWTIDSE
jgi:hypothetical protein